MPMSTFMDGLRYPWAKPGRLWNILWFFVPIIGWFALMGYMVRIVQALNKGKVKELPVMDNFWDKFTLGLMMFIKMLPFCILLGIVSWILRLVPVAGAIAYGLIVLLIVPYLTINLFVTEKFASLFEFSKAVKVVANNFKKYVIALLLSLFYGAVYVVLSIVLVGIPCLMFGKSYFMVEFYRTAKK
ncbi:DUF4013 domain-containing protein [archaeon]|nr:DUF4013 domain-containing protein [archaeon]